MNKECCKIGDISESPDGDGSECASVSCSQTPVAYNSLQWYICGSWTGLTESEVLKLAEKIMVDDFQIAGGAVAYKIPPPTLKKIGPYARKSV